MPREKLLERVKILPMVVLPAPKHAVALKIAPDARTYTIMLRGCIGHTGPREQLPR